MVEPTSIVAIVLASLTALAGAITGLHIKRMNSGCCDIECFKPPNSSPTQSTPTQSTSNLNVPRLKESIYIDPQSTV